MKYLVILSYLLYSGLIAEERPNIILLMSDDQGWGQTGYNNHPILKTPNLDNMASNGLRLDRFYSGAATCSPTRATVLTGRSNNRTGVLNHGYGLNLQEKTLPKALKDAGYNTAHFGKWHLNYIGGPGVPMAKEDPHGPGKYGFDYWLTSTNYFDMNPMLSRNGTFEKMKGDSSEIIVDQAIKYIRDNKNSGRPFFTAIWYGSPHEPFEAREDDLKLFPSLDKDSQAHYAELVAMDRSIGTLRKSLKTMGLAENTLIWFSSDNGGLPLGKVNPITTGGLRGFKKSQYEGGIRVPCIIEWPKGISAKISNYPAYTSDTFPTLVSILGLDKNSINSIIDGKDISPLFNKELTDRDQPMFFSQMSSHAMIDKGFKLLIQDKKKPELYELQFDPTESHNLAETQPVRVIQMQQKLDHWLLSVENSSKGKDYPEGKITSEPREKLFWSESPYYKPFLKLFSMDERLAKAIEFNKKSNFLKNRYIKNIPKDLYHLLLEQAREKSKFISGKVIMVGPKKSRVDYDYPIVTISKYNRVKNIADVIIKNPRNNMPILQKWSLSGNSWLPLYSK